MIRLNNLVICFAKFLHLYCIVDIETTGSYASGSGITEISAYKHDGKCIVEHFTTLINPERKIPIYITALTGISNAMVASAPVFDEVADKLFEFLQGNIFVAHNVNFDYSFIKHHLSKSGYELNLKKICTVRLARKVFPGLPSYSLGRLCKSVSIPIENRHRADGDAKATCILFEQMLSLGGQLFIDEMLKKASGDQYLPLQISKSIINNLPTCAGVYYFKDEKKKVLYVGKAINIKKRVLSHFTSFNTGDKRQNFLRQIHDISFETCANELHALVLESTEIKRLWPKFNRSQKDPLVKYALYSYEDRAGYLRLALDKKRKNIHCHCTFNSLHDAVEQMRQLVTDYNLHLPFCFMVKTITNSSLAECNDTVKKYNTKVRKALEALDLQLPSYAVMENVEEEKKTLCLLVEKGIFWGMGYLDVQDSKDDLEQLKNVLQPYRDNNFIRNSLHHYALENPEKVLHF